MIWWIFVFLSVLYSTHIMIHGSGKSWLNHFHWFCISELICRIELLDVSMWNVRQLIWCNNVHKLIRTYTYKRAELVVKFRRENANSQSNRKSNIFNLNHRFSFCVCTRAGIMMVFQTIFPFQVCSYILNTFSLSILFFLNIERLC